jgi:hypothetical protein
MADAVWHSAEVLAPIVVGFSAGLALVGLALYAFAPPPVLSMSAHYALQAMGGLCGGWGAWRCSRPSA